MSCWTCVSSYRLHTQYNNFTIKFTHVSIISYYNALILCLFVCLSPIQICTAARIDSKCSMPGTCKHSTCLDSILLYEVQGFNVFVHAMLEYMQQAGITYEMPASYKLACTHWQQTHWHRQAGVDYPSSVHLSRKFHLRYIQCIIIATTNLFAAALRYMYVAVYTCTYTVQDIAKSSSTKGANSNAMVYYSPLPSSRCPTHTRLMGGGKAENACLLTLQDQPHRLVCVGSGIANVESTLPTHSDTCHSQQSCKGDVPMWQLSHL